MAWVTWAQRTFMIYVRKAVTNRPISWIPQCTWQIYRNAPFCDRNGHTFTHFCYKMVHCGIWDRCIMGFVRWVYCQHNLQLLLDAQNFLLGFRLTWCRDKHHNPYRWYRDYWDDYVASSYICRLMINFNTYQVKNKLVKHATIEHRGQSPDNFSLGNISGCEIWKLRENSCRAGITKRKQNSSMWNIYL